jgi:DNA processing protein
MKTKYLIALNKHPKIGSQTLKKILLNYTDPAELWQEKRSLLCIKLGEKLASIVSEATTKFDPDAEVNKLNQYDIGYITIFDATYPKMLKEIYDCPTIIYLKGNIKLFNTLALGVVGSRKYTHYGKSYAYKISKECAEAGLTIVSGLALGVDAFAHEAALDALGNTIGVLGCGLDKIYPVSNFHLGKRMLDNNGLIISEFPLGTVPMKQNFPARNRIIAGLSLGVFVVEAAEKSGALITAYQSLEYDREVFALPGNIDSPNSLGTNRLIQAGAKLVISSDDILQELNIIRKTSQKKIKELIPESNDEKVVIKALRERDCLVDELIQETGLNIVAVNGVLTILEMKGYVSNLGGGRYHLMSE